MDCAHHRSYFYVGGGYVDDGKGNQIFEGQMYVERLTPAAGTDRPYPIIFIHGGGQTGTNFLNTPDNRPGWATYLMSRGYEVYLLDQTSRGRSSVSPNGKLVHYSYAMVEQRFTACSSFPDLYPAAKLHTEWPGTGLRGDPTFDAFYSSMVPALGDYVEEQRLMQNAGAALLDKVGPAVLITHSQGGVHGWTWADARPNLVRAIVAVEPSGPPFQSTLIRSGAGNVKKWGVSDIPLVCEPSTGDEGMTHEVQEDAKAGRYGDMEFPCILQKAPARQLVNLAKVPVLLETAEASMHCLYDEFTVKFLQQAGVPVEWMRLADVGVKGNGHMQMMEKNNLDVIEVLEGWIARTVER